MEKHSAYLGAASVKLVGSSLQRNLVKKMLVDIGDELVGKGALGCAAVTAGIKAAAQRRQEQEKPCQKVEPCVGNAAKSEVMKSGTEFFVGAVITAIEVHLTERTVVEWAQQPQLGVNGSNERWGKLNGDSLIRLVGTYDEFVGFCGSHNENVVRL